VRDVAIVRVKTLGGKNYRAVEESGTRRIVALDPDGNEFCLVRDED